MNSFHPTNQPKDGWFLGEILLEWYHRGQMKLGEKSWIN